MLWVIARQTDKPPFKARATWPVSRQDRAQATSNCPIPELTGTIFTPPECIDVSAGLQLAHEAEIDELLRLGGYVGAGQADEVERRAHPFIARDPAGSPIGCCLNATFGLARISFVYR
jgi:hypothetical protein